MRSREQFDRFGFSIFSERTDLPGILECINLIISNYTSKKLEMTFYDGDFRGIAKSLDSSFDLTQQILRITKKYNIQSFYISGLDDNCDFVLAKDYLGSRWKIGASLKSVESWAVVTQSVRLFIEMCQRSYSSYGYFSSIKRLPREKTVYLHVPSLGPSRLEWMNWFGPEYTEVFDVPALQKASHIHCLNKQNYYLLSVCQNPWDYDSITVRLSAKALTKSLGVEAFSNYRYRAKDFLTWEFIGGTGIYKHLIPANKVPLQYRHNG